MQVGVAGSVGSGLGVVGSTGFAFDTHGNVVSYVTGGGGAAIGANEGIGLTIQGSNAQNVNDLSGFFGNTSGSGGYIVGGTLDGFVGNSSDGPVEGGGVTFGQDTGASLFVGATYTYLSKPVSIWQFLGYLFIPGYDPFVFPTNTPLSPNKSSSSCNN